MTAFIFNVTVLEKEKKNVLFILIAKITINTLNFSKVWLQQLTL